MIRKAELSDLSDLNILYIEQNRFHHNITPDRIALCDELLTHEELAEMIAETSTYLTVYVLDGKLVAALLANLQRNEAKRWTPKRCFVYLDELIVMQEYRSKGIAREMMDAFEDWAMEQGASCIDLNVWQHNSNALEFYQKNGFYTEQRLMSKNLE
ncbi:GNAT family N-acetyltransferase [Vibrio tapetis]|uniref:N-acetyltransferase domain-containing protein n=1 Tax=Vibrio tapetis subsp. tapetis TaxID=1671868 RepID=A0A2N8ZMA3_9VIBR|nr:GNAT family N-acetyltransferase [Vibrio tapetis]SON53030.1 conserved protein of unknown function [Vibrio tapetis subsp. tapetis]